MKNKVSLGVFIIVVAILSLLFLGGDKKSSDRVVKIGYLSFLAGSPWAIADNEQMFQKENIQVEGVRFESSNQLYDALAKGDIDITPNVSILPVMINHITDPGKIKIFSTVALTTQNPFDLVIAKNESNITSLDNLVGKKIGLFPGSSPTIFLKEFLKKNNVDVSKIEFVQIPPQNQLQALEAGSIDALYSYEPNLSVAISKGGVRIVGGPVYASFVEEAPIGVAAISQKFINEDEDLAKKTIKVFDQSFDFANNNTNETRTIIGKAFNIDKTVTDRMTLLTFSLSDKINKQKVADFVDVLVNFGDLESKPNLETVFYK